MIYSWLELMIAVTLAFFIGGVIGMEHGWTQACARATALYEGHKAGEIVVPVPVKFLNGVVFGTAFIKNQICEGR
jgi:hypothetical protein